MNEKTLTTTEARQGDRRNVSLRVLSASLALLAIISAAVLALTA